MIISSLQKANKLTLNIQSIGEKKKQQQTGIYIDKNLNWVTHIQHIYLKTWESFFNYVISCLSYHYGIMSWGSTYPSRLTKVQTNQNRCIRCICFSHSIENGAPYFKLLDIFIFKLKIFGLTSQHNFTECSQYP